ncbi:MAG: hypothetical protein M3177_00980 [Pseudomonadota bacterium]|nr:hypothetical protein [Pseudomonadota bacterium]
MDSDAYRRQLLSEIEAATAAPSQLVAPAQLKAAAEEAPEQLVERICSLSLRPDSFDASVRLLLSIAADKKRPAAARLAALQRLSGAHFQTHRFQLFTAEYREVLRKTATDRSSRLREAALERLTLFGDREAQKLLRESLSPEGRTLLRPEKAVQLLARDDHASAKALFRELAEKGTGKVREEALRALASDSRSAKLLEGIAGNKAETPAIRQVAAAGLKAASAPRFARLAQKLILDRTEDDSVRAAAAVGIAHSKEVRDRLAKPTFERAIAKVQATTKSRALRKSARQLVQRLRSSG